MWEYFERSMKDATKLCTSNKKITNHSNPFWYQELTHASKELRILRRNIRYNSNYRNLTKLTQAEENFKTLLSEKASNWRNEYLLSLGQKRGKEFWMSYKKLFSENKPKVGIIKNSLGELFYTLSEISKEFQETFFEGKHFHKQTFDESREKTVKSFLQQSEEIGEHNVEVFQEFFSSEELNDALKQCPSSNSFDPDGFNIQMMKKRGDYARTFLLEISNKRWNEAVWPWTQSRVIFIRDRSKTKCDDCSSYRPLTISSHFSKPFERMLCTRVKSHLETDQ